ncbi:uncharacterized protein BXZ73DRAFT_76392 [Epithele typhae]|uniref:uncharacterized protein n=1 Tax=Epithele typhae TaxID=378194 RepID=UPI002007BEFA|nr:uncharacterized protein BXZ73DRAFT_76392 [Epithele typhae]KAH9938899.1 hypothetical protein BXZ73DRAFT_76392 [Epithele typhae]
MQLRSGNRKRNDAPAPKPGRRSTRKRDVPPKAASLPKPAAPPPAEPQKKPAKRTRRGPQPAPEPMEDALELVTEGFRLDSRASSPSDESTLTPGTPMAANESVLPNELWLLVLDLIEERRDLAIMVSTCSYLRSHAAEMLRDFTFVLRTDDDVTNFVAAVEKDPSLVTRVRELRVDTDEGFEEEVQVELYKVLLKLTGLYTFALYGPYVVWAEEFLDRLGCITFPCLTTFETPIYTRFDMTEFAASNRSIRHLEIPRYSEHDGEVRLHHLQSMSVPYPVVHRFSITLKELQETIPDDSELSSEDKFQVLAGSVCHNISHLCLTASDPYAPVTLSRLVLGQQVVSLRLAAPQRPKEWLANTGEYDLFFILKSFPRLKFLEHEMRGYTVVSSDRLPGHTSFWELQYEWTTTPEERELPHRKNAGSLTVAWSFIDIRGSALRPERDDELRTLEPPEREPVWRAKCEERAESLLRNTGMYVDRVMYGKCGALDTVVTMPVPAPTKKKGKGKAKTVKANVERLEKPKEMYWRTIPKWVEPKKEEDAKEES